jgi:hypothetical protein
MNIRLAIGGIFAALIGALMLGVFETSTDRVYPLAPAKINKILDEATLPPEIFANRALSAKHWRENTSTSVWALLGDNDVELLRLIATTKAENDGARVHFDVQAPPGANYETVNKSLEGNSAISDLYRAALAEQIDANIKNRDFSLAQVSPAIARVTLTALPHLRDQLKRAEQEDQKQQDEQIDQVYKNEK